MTAFEFVFSLFGLLLGLCVAEVLGGLGRAMESRDEVEIGWLTPLLGFFILLDLTSYWGALWYDRESVIMTPLTLILGIIIAGAYYLASYLIFPDEIRRYRDLDLHFFQVRRTVVGIALVTLLVQFALQLIVTEQATVSGTAFTLAILVPAYLVAMLAKRKALVGVGLVTMITVNLIGATEITIAHLKTI